MKKLLFSALFTSVICHAQTSVYTEDFENVTDLYGANWTLYNDTNTPYGTYAALFSNAWEIVKWSAESGNTVVSSPSWFTTIAPADRWLISPAITLPTNSTISLEFFARSHDVSPYDDGFKLKISTTNTTKAAFTNIQTVDHAPNVPISSQLTPYTVNLSAYAGQTVYLAWVNDYTNGNLLSVDDINVTATPLMSVSDFSKKSLTLYPNPTDNYFQLNSNNEKPESVKVYDLSGKLIKEFSDLNSEKYDIANLKPGIYNVSVQSSKSTQNIKLIKK